jgi:alkane 1-monooxygenase
MTELTIRAIPAQAGWRDSKRYLWLYTLYVPLLPILGYALARRTGHDGWWWMPLAVVFVVIPALDLLGRTDDENPPEDLVPELESQLYYRIVTFAYLPLMAGGVVLGAWLWARGGMSWGGRLGLIFAVGSVTGIGIANAHELGHKRDALETWWARVVLSFTGYGHFFVEHNRGHHVRVATPEDPASSRLGESFYRFWPRTVTGGMVSGWSLEAKRLRLRDRSPFSIHNQVLTAWLMTPVVFGAIAAVFGAEALIFLVAQAVWGFTLLEVVNYVEHYGLLRQRTPSGRYEAVRPEHSWNSNALVTNIFLLNLQRHSDHHANPRRRYNVLRTFSEAPELPGGYATMIVLALVPPLWRRVMDPRVLAHYAGDISRANLAPHARAGYLQRYGQASVTS